MSEKSLDWENDKRLTHWLGNRTKKGTVALYRKAMEEYVNFTGLTPEQLIQEKYEDTKKPPMDQGVAEDRLRAFNKFLNEEYVKRDGTKGMAPKGALSHCAAIADFYRRHNLRLNIKMTQEFSGATKGINETEKMTAEQIEDLASYAPTLRDKALIWAMFQGGMDVSTVLSLNWGHVEKEIEKPPMEAIMLRSLSRKKEPNKTFDTFIYKTAIKYLKAYLRERFGDDYANKIDYNAPLFVGHGGGRTKAKSGETRLEPRYIERTLSIIATKTMSRGRLEQADLNPQRPHAMRASFSDRMAKAGANKIFVDYLMGHKLQFDKAYFGGEQGLRETYVKYAEMVLEPKGAGELTAEAQQKIAALEEKVGDVQSLRELAALQRTELQRLQEKLTLMEPLIRHLVQTELASHEVGDLGNLDSLVQKENLEEYVNRLKKLQEIL